MCISPSLLSAYLDGEVGVDDCGQVRTHLRSCQRCRESLANLGQLQGFISASCLEPSVDPSVALARFRRHNARRSSRARLCWMARPMAREVAQVGLSLAAAGVFFVSGLLLTSVGAPKPGGQPLASVTWDVMDSYSPHPTELASFQRRLQTMEANFEVTVPGDFSLPSAFEVGAYVAEQER